MTARRTFLKTSIIGATALTFGDNVSTKGAASPARVVSTWDFGVAANQAAWGVLGSGGRALDAVEAGASVPEADLKNHSIGRAGYPDRDGHVSLDASIMNGDGSCGAVAAKAGLRRQATAGMPEVEQRRSSCRAPQQTAKLARRVRRWSGA